MIRSRVLISGDPLSRSRGAEETKLAIEAEISYYGLTDEVQVAFTGQVDRTDALPMVVVYPEGTRYGPVSRKMVLTSSKNTSTKVALWNIFSLHRRP